VIRICGKESWTTKIIVEFGLIAGCSAAALATNPITGVARNRTRGEFAGLPTSNSIAIVGAWAFIFGSGYAPYLCALAVYHLWRGRTPTNPSLSN